MLKLATLPMALAINLGGEALYAGITAAAVIHWREGRPLTDRIAIARKLPYKRLIAIDVIVVVATAVGAILLIVPGILVFTYLLIAPPLIEIKGISVRAAIGQSIELVRGNFWRVLGIGLSALILTDSIATAVESPLHGVEGALLINVVVEAALEPFQGLVTVLMALALMEIHGQVVEGRTPLS